MGDSKWVEWEGLEPSPFIYGDKCIVRYRGYPDRQDDTLKAWMYRNSGWIHNGSHRDIVAYRKI